MGSQEKAARPVSRQRGITPTECDARHEARIAAHSARVLAALGDPDDRREKYGVKRRRVRNVYTGEVFADHYAAAAAMRERGRTNQSPDSVRKACGRAAHNETSEWAWLPPAAAAPAYPSAPAAGWPRSRVHRPFAAA